MKHEFQIQDLKDDLIDEISQEVSHFSLPLFYKDKFIGSGTFVLCGRHYGILTATHVIECLKGALMTTSKHGEYSKGIMIEQGQYDIVTLGNRSTDINGPDMGFINLRDENFISFLKQQRSYFNLTKPDEKSLRDANINAGIIVFAGYFYFVGLQC